MAPPTAPSYPTAPDETVRPRPDTRLAARRSWRSALWDAARLVAPGPAELPHRYRWRLAIGCGAAAAALMLLRLFVPTAVGVADQGVGQSLACRLSVADPTPYNYTASTQFIFPSWLPHQWYGEDCPGSGAPFASWLLVLRAAGWATPLLGHGPGLDLRLAAVVAVLLVGVLIALLVALLPGRPGFRILAAAGVTAVTADGVFSDFFDSTYPQAASLLGALAVIVALMFLWRRDTVDAVGLLAVTGAGAFALLAQPIMAALLPVLAVALVWRPFGTGGSRPRRRRAPSRAQRSATAILRRLPAVACIAALTLAVGANLDRQPDARKQQVLYGQVFQQILPASPHPAADLQWFGLPASWASASGQPESAPQSAVFQKDWPSFAQHVTTTRILAFYLTHPERLVPLADQGLNALAHPELDYLGSYLPGSGHPAGAKEHRFPLVQAISTVLAALPLLIVLLQAITAALAAAVAARRRLGARAVALGRAVAFSSVATWSLFWATLLLRGAPELDRSMLTATYLSSLSLVWIPLLALLLARHRSPAAAGGRR